jgi:hypothetical protein
MAKSAARRPAIARKPVSAEPRREIRVSAYFSKAMYEAVRNAAYEDHRKINDLIVEGITTVLKRRGRKGYPQGRTGW